MGKNKRKSTGSSGSGSGAGKHQNSPSILAKSVEKRKNKGQSKEKIDDNNDRITWEDIAAMSDSDDDTNDKNGGNANLEALLKSKAKSLQQAINDGKLNELVASLNKSKRNNEPDDDDDDEEFEEADLDASSEEDEEEEEDVEGGEDVRQEEDNEERDDDDDEDDGDDSENDEDIKDDDEEEADDSEEDEADEEDEKEEAAVATKITSKVQLSKKHDMDEDEDGDDNDDVDEEEEEEENDEDNDDENDEEDEKVEKYKRMLANNFTNSKALSVVLAEVSASHSKLPWAETFVVIPPTPLPFGDKGDPENNPLDIHDDLKREVAFYNTALEAVNIARIKCKDAGVPFARPEDFFAEMVKTDDHMAKVKDRLIFEGKKIEAVAQRKSNKEQKLRARESQANRLAEKSKRKREHFQQVEEWANSAAKQRGGALRDDADDQYMNGRNNNNRSNNGPNKKRQIADRKYGFGGKKGRFKQNDRQSMNDMSGFNPRGNFPGGMKRTSKSKGSSGSGANRAGKRARDAKRARR